MFTLLLLFPDYMGNTVEFCHLFFLYIWATVSPHLSFVPTPNPLPLHLSSGKSSPPMSINKT